MSNTILAIDAIMAALEIASRYAAAIQKVRAEGLSISDEEMLTLDSESLLTRLFQEEDVRVFKPRILKFNCSCSRERVAGMLKTLGEAEVAATLNDHNPIEVRCEYCDRVYQFDAVDAAQLFAHSKASPPGPQAIQ